MSARKPAKRRGKEKAKAAVHADQTTPHVPPVDVAATSADEPDPTDRSKDTAETGEFPHAPAKGAKPKAAAERKTRKRLGGFPKPYAGDQPYAKRRFELKGMSEAETLQLILESDAWREVIAPVIDALDKKLRARKKVEPLYTTQELESVLLFQFLCDEESYRKTRTYLTSDRCADVRKLLGLNRRRNRANGKVTKLRDGVPSEATISRYKMRFAPEHLENLRARQRASFEFRAELYEQLFTRLVDDYLFSPEGREEALITQMDGTAVSTHFTCPISENGVVKNDKPRRRDLFRRVPAYDEKGRLAWDGLLSDAEWEAVVAQQARDKRHWKINADGGYMPQTGPISKRGHGWNVGLIQTANGLPLAFDVTAVQAPEPLLGEELVKQLTLRLERRKAVDAEQGIAHEQRLGVISTDANFNRPETRRLVREIGYLENTHLVSHGKDSEPIAELENDRKIPFKVTAGEKNKDLKNWYTNGHREIKCRCGKARISKDVGLSKSGRAYARVQGNCDKCGCISITSGEWRLVDNSRRWGRVNPSTDEQPEWILGNPLTFNDAIAKEYGLDRFGQNEGFNSTLGSRFGLNRGKRWIRHGAQVRLEIAMAGCVMHILAAEQRRRARAGQAPPQPASALAA